MHISSSLCNHAIEMLFCAERTEVTDWPDLHCPTLPGTEFQGLELLELLPRACLNPIGWPGRQV